jgi:hypothetical protein
MRPSREVQAYQSSQKYEDFVSSSCIFLSLSLSLSPFSTSQFCNFVIKLWKNNFVYSTLARDEQRIELGGDVVGASQISQLDPTVN